MIINNMFNGILGFILGVFFVIGFGPSFATLLELTDTSVKIFIGVIIIVVLTTVLAWNPIITIVADEQERIN